MIGYRDTTFCPHWKECKSGVDCPKALTDEIKESAKLWWGSCDAPIAIYIDKPKCFEMEK